MSEQWTVEEQTLIDASQTYFQAIAAVEAAGGRTQAAIMAAMPAEVRDQIPGASMAEALEGI